MTRDSAVRSAPFDAYHAWLGIPPDEQPPNHYRLLGLRLFESDANAISNAADQRMMYLRSMGNNNIAQGLLNEVSAARVCLLSAAKDAYDRGLRAPEMMVVPPPLIAEVVPEVELQQRIQRGYNTRRQRNWRATVVVCSVLAAILSGALLWVLLGRNDPALSGKVARKSNLPGSTIMRNIIEQVVPDTGPGADFRRTATAKLRQELGSLDFEITEWSLVRVLDRSDDSCYSLDARLRTRGGQQAFYRFWFDSQGRISEWVSLPWWPAYLRQDSGTPSHSDTVEDVFAD